MKSSLKLLVASLVLYFPISSHADPYALPEDIRPTLLSETVPFTFTPSTLSSADYELTWQGAALEGVDLQVEQGSLEWVRINSFLDLPRLRVAVHATNLTAGKVTNAGMNEVFTIDAAQAATVVIPVAGMSGSSNLIDITIVRNGKELTAHAVLKLKPAPSNQERLLVDTSCSPYNVKIENADTVAKSALIYVGCRLVHSKSEDHKKASLELYLYWDGISHTINADGVSVLSNGNGIWLFRMKRDPGKITLKHEHQEFNLTYSIPEQLKKTFLGFGLGPYLYRYQAGEENFHTVMPLATLYGSYFFTEKLRLVLFDAVAIQQRFFSDTGVYFLIEQTRAFDERFSINLLLGAHAILLKTKEGTSFIPGGPQGFELVFRDFGKKQYNLSSGAFIYPKFNESSYYNVWARWGKQGWFLELNYLAFREPVNDVPVVSSSVGLTLGMPLGSFF